MQEQDWISARHSLEEHLEKLPRDGEAHLKLAEVYGELDSVRQFLFTLDRVRGLSDDYSNKADFIAEKVWFENYNRGLKHFDSGLYDEALASFDRAVQIQPDNLHSLKRYGDCYFVQERTEEAKDVYLRVLAINSQDTEVKNKLAILYLQEGDYDAAVELCNEVLAARPFDGQALLTRARTYDQIGHLREAELDLRLLSGALPSASIFAELGMFYFEHGQFDKAVGPLTEAAILSPGAINIYRSLGEANEHLGNYGEMMKWYEKVVENEPENIEGWQRLAIAYKALGQQELFTVTQRRIRRLTGSN